MSPPIAFTPPSQAHATSQARSSQLQERIAALQQLLAEGRAVATAQRLQLAAVRNDTLEATQELVRAAPTLAAAAAAAGPQQQQEQEETEEGLQQQVGEIEVGRVGWRVFAHPTWLIHIARGLYRPSIQLSQVCMLTPQPVKAFRFVRVSLLASANISQK